MRRYVELVVVALVSAFLVHLVPVVSAGGGQREIFGMNARIRGWSGMVAFFPGECPSRNWEEFLVARGRYIVGVPEDGTVLGASGTVLTDLEVRRGGTAHDGPTFTPGSLTYTFPNLDLDVDLPSLDYVPPGLVYSPSTATYTASSLAFSAGSASYTQPTLSYTQPTASYARPSASYVRPSATFTLPSATFSGSASNTGTANQGHTHVYSDRGGSITRIRVPLGGASDARVISALSDSSRRTNTPSVSHLHSATASGSVSLSGGGVSLSGGGVSLSGGGVSLSGGSASLSGGGLTYTPPSATFTRGSFDFTQGTASLTGGTATLNPGGTTGSLVGGSIDLTDGAVHGGAGPDEDQPAPYIQLRACRYLP